MVNVIGLHGAKGSGKDQFFKAVKAAFPHIDVRKVAYADPIKNELCRIFDLANEEEYDKLKRSFVEFKLGGGMGRAVPGRQVVREIGMMMRRYDEHQFVKYVEDQIHGAPDAIWFVTDLRFDNELNSIRQLGGQVVKIKRSGYQFDGHATETEIADEHCDLVIHNDNLTLEQYNQLVVWEMNKIMLQLYKGKL